MSGLYIRVFLVVLLFQFLPLVFEVVKLVNYNINLKVLRKLLNMGNEQVSHEISLEEQELFEMQVDDEYNPKSILDHQQARFEYIQRIRVLEAE